MIKHIAIEWSDGKGEGFLEISNGELLMCGIAVGSGRCSKEGFVFENSGPCRIEAVIDDMEGKKPPKTIGGVYDAGSETVTVESFTGSAEVVLYFN